jgi:hypothetical protein
MREIDDLRMQEFCDAALFPDSLPLRRGLGARAGFGWLRPDRLKHGHERREDGRQNEWKRGQQNGWENGQQDG